MHGPACGLHVLLLSPDLLSDAVHRLDYSGTHLHASQASATPTQRELLNVLLVSQPTKVHTLLWQSRIRTNHKTRSELHVVQVSVPKRNVETCLDDPKGVSTCIWNLAAGIVLMTRSPLLGPPGKYRWYKTRCASAARAAPVDHLTSEASNEGLYPSHSLLGLYDEVQCSPSGCPTRRSLLSPLVSFIIRPPPPNPIFTPAQHVSFNPYIIGAKLNSTVTPRRFLHMRRAL